MKLSHIEARKKSYLRWKKARFQPHNIEYIPLALLDYWHMQGEPEFYLMELYREVEEQEERLERYVRRIEQLEQKVLWLEQPQQGWWQRLWMNVTSLWTGRK